MRIIKSIWSKARSIFEWFGIVNSTQKMIDSFPGMDDPEKLRLWIIENADNFLPLVLKTKNKVDDLVLSAVKKIALDKKAFLGLFNLLLFAYNWFPQAEKEPVFGANGLNCFSGFCDAINDKDAVENPLMFITVAGLLIQVIMYIRSQDVR